MLEMTRVHIEIYVLFRSGLFNLWILRVCVIGQVSRSQPYKSLIDTTHCQRVNILVRDNIDFRLYIYINLIQKVSIDVTRGEIWGLALSPQSICFVSRLKCVSKEHQFRPASSWSRLFCRNTDINKTKCPYAFSPTISKSKALTIVCCFVRIWVVLNYNYFFS